MVYAKFHKNKPAFCCYEMQKRRGHQSTWRAILVVDPDNSVIEKVYALDEHGNLLDKLPRQPRRRTTAPPRRARLIGTPLDSGEHQARPRPRPESNEEILQPSPPRQEPQERPRNEPVTTQQPKRTTPVPPKLRWKRRTLVA